MATERVYYSAQAPLSNVGSGCCKEVYICLLDECSYMTADGSGMVLATPMNGGRPLGHSPNINRFENVRCEDIYQYGFRYDDSQMALDISGIPYVFGCGCIAEINPYACTTSKIIEGSISFDRIGISNTSVYPEEESIIAGRTYIISLVGHDVDPDGLYYYNGTDWVMLGAY